MKRHNGEETKMAGGGEQYLTFVLGGEVFSMAISRIQEIIEYGELTYVPLVPEFIRGVFNLRGRVVPVIDLSVRLGRHPAELSVDSCIVIVEVAAGEGEEPLAIGMLVDGVRQVLEIAAAQIEPPPAFGARVRTDFIEGMVPAQGGFMILLQVDAVLSVEEMSLLDRVVGEQESGAEAPFAPVAGQRVQAAPQGRH
ncbi:chemotaxis protein CheW [Endothiovibrio diazotrophicus]